MQRLNLKLKFLFIPPPPTNWLKDSTNAINISIIILYYAIFIIYIIILNI